MRKESIRSLSQMLCIASNFLEKNAIMTPGPVVGDIRGSIGGTTFSRNKGGLYAKVRVTPVNPSTTRQVDVRADFASLISDWRLILSFNQRQAWIDFAAASPILNRLGQSILISGLNWYSRSNIALLQASLARVDDPPPLGLFPPPDGSFAVSDIDAGALNFDIDFDITQPWVSTDGAAMLVYGSKLVSTGVSNFNVPYRFAAAILGDATTPPTSPATVVYPFSGVPAGNQVTAKATIVLPDGTTVQNMQSPYLIA